MNTKVTMKIIGRNQKGDKRVWNLPNPKNSTKRRYVEAFMERCLAKGVLQVNNSKIDSVIGIKRMEYGDWHEKDDACLAKCAVTPNEKEPSPTNPPGAPPAPAPAVTPQVPTPEEPPSPAPVPVTPVVAPAPTFKSRAASFLSNMLPSLSF